MRVYEPKFRIRDNFIGKVLKVISILTFVGGIITGLGYMFDGEGGIGLIFGFVTFVVAWIKVDLNNLPDDIYFK